MIVWRQSPPSTLPALPPCLDGWEPRGADAYQLVHRDTAEGHVVGVGDPLVWAAPRRWLEADPGWEVAAVPGSPVDPAGLARSGILWCDVEPVDDLQRRRWYAPIVRRQGGGRAFRVAYGRDWLPALTPEQERAEAICAAVVGAAEQDTPMVVACQWAAELLAITHHVSVAALAALALLDEPLVVGVLRVASALSIENGRAAHAV